jgi:hypothetical protein
MDERALEVQRIGDDVSGVRRDPETFDDEILARARVRDVADLRRLRVDECCERRPWDSLAPATRAPRVMQRASRRSTAGR